MIDATHDPGLASWVDSANAPDSDFPIQNLPFGRFRRAARPQPWRIGVAIGDQVLDLEAALAVSPWVPQLQALMRPLAEGDLNTLLAQGTHTRRLVRAALSSALREGSGHRSVLAGCLVPQSAVEMSPPVAIGDYADFDAAPDDATGARRPAPLPTGRQGCVSSIRVSGQEVRRPSGLLSGAGGAAPLAPSRRLDYELELGALIGPASTLGEPLPMDAADDALAGLVLLNDWSARDLPAFLSKSFATTISPWLVTMEALEPFRAAPAAGAAEPPPHLDSPRNRAAGAFDIVLEAWLQSAAMRARGQGAVRLGSGNFRHARWTLAQLAAHHTSNGCSLNTGDLLAAGASEPGGAGSLLELTRDGQVPVALPGGERRGFLEDGDMVTLRARAERPGFRRIGFGDCSGRVAQALSKP